jgi:hypothetical protein
MEYEDIPLIENVSFLKGHDLLIHFDNGEERIVDMSESFEVPAALKYAPLSIFKGFSFNTHSIWWGDEDWIVGHDSLYSMSVPLPQFVSSMFLSMGVVDHRTEPFEGWIKVYGNEDRTGHKEPHAHVEYKGNKLLFALYGGLLVPAPTIPNDIVTLLDEWVQKNRKIAVEEWNKWNPALEADPNTGRRK